MFFFGRGHYPVRFYSWAIWRADFGRLMPAALALGSKSRAERRTPFQGCFRGIVCVPYRTVCAASHMLTRPVGRAVCPRMTRFSLRLCILQPTLDNRL